jgi:putative FmdB family regulatory protein
MPTYEYACRECGHRFDQVQSIHDDALTVCPECGGDLRKVMSPVGIHFKGSGFYRNDSRKAKPGAKAKPTTAAGDSAASGESGSDSAPSASGDGDDKQSGAAKPAAEKSAGATTGKSKDAGASAGSSSTKASPGTPPAG